MFIKDVDKLATLLVEIMITISVECACHFRRIHDDIKFHDEKIEK